MGGSAFALLLQGGVFASTYGVTAFFSDAAGINPGDEVTVAGLSAGTVKGLSIEHGHVAMDLAVDSGVQLPKDSRAMVKVQTLLGRETVELVAAPIHSPGLTEGHDAPNQPRAVFLRFEQNRPILADGVVPDRLAGGRAYRTSQIEQESAAGIQSRMAAVEESRQFVAAVVGIKQVVKNLADRDDSIA